MAFKDLRQFIDKLDETGDLVRIKQEIDWDLEAGAIGRHSYETSGPAVLFEKIKDYPEGYRIFNGSLGTFRRVSVSLGLPPETSIPELYRVYEQRNEKPLKPKIVTDGPCKEIVMEGDSVDLNSLPTPYLHEGDGGRYIGTWSFTVSHDPETGWENWGMYRFMIHNPRYIVGWPRMHSHLGMILHGQYVPQKKPMPIALVLGADALCHMVATAPFRIGVNEAEQAGALRQEPLELVKCNTSDLMVPANSEIVIEGEIQPDRTATEGPFGEYPGYRTEGVRAGVLVKVKAITHRKSPILTTISLGIPPDDSSIAASLTAGLAMKARLVRHKIPITDVFVPPEGVTHIVVVGVTKGGGAIAAEITDVLTSRRADVNKVIVVDDDIDVFDMGQVMHALATKCHPIRGIHAREVEAGKANPLTPCYTGEERRAHRGAVVTFDCTWPPEWSRQTEVPVKSSFEVMFPQELKDRVLRDWKKLGF